MDTGKEDNKLFNHGNPDSMFSTGLKVLPNLIHSSLPHDRAIDFNPV